MSWTNFFNYIRQILSYRLFTLNDASVTVSSVLIFFILLIVFITLAITVRKVLSKNIFGRFKIDPGTGYTLSRIAQYLIITIGVLISFNAVGFNLSSLTVIFGLLSVGIGFGLQNITSNFISGLIILFERPISVGDRVEVNNIEGDIMEINIRSTMVRTVNNISIIVPNSQFIEKDVVNYSHGDPSFRLDVKIGVAYGSDLDTVLNALTEIAEKNPHIMKDPVAEVHFIDFGDSAWNMQLRCWVEDVKHYPTVRNQINQAIVRTFRKYNIEIPFPQRDLHMRSSVTLPIDSGDAQD